MSWYVLYIYMSLNAPAQYILKLEYVNGQFTFKITVVLYVLKI